MIANERQYKITKAQLRKLEKGLSDLNKRDTSDPLVDLSIDALGSEIEVLRSQLAEYEALRAGKEVPVTVASLGELPQALVKARIACGMSQRELAEALGWKEQQIQRYEAGEYSSASLRRLLAVASVLHLDVAHEVREKDETACLSSNEPHDLEWSNFPIKEMYRRHWFEGFQGSLDAALQGADTLVQDYVKSVVRQPALALHRKHVRAGSSLDECALLAWECRVLHLAENADLGARYRQGLITSKWLTDLVRLSRLEDGPLRARKALAAIGIAMVVEPHLPGTYLDGASLLLGDTPVVGLTLRYDRVDNFWFVLLHELTHVDKHLRKGRLTRTFDDLDVESDDRIEHEADSGSAETLLSSSSWDLALARYVRTPESVIALADELGISSAIVAGRIRREANNYVILSDLVGSGQVRRLFGEVDFSG